MHTVHTEPLACYINLIHWSKPEKNTNKAVLLCESVREIILAEATVILKSHTAPEHFKQVFSV